VGLAARGAAVRLAPGEALVTSFRGGRFPFIFCGGTLARSMAAALGAGLASILGRVNGRNVEVDGPLDKGLPTPGLPAEPPGAPTRR
jgi:hypothetical protein